MRSRLVYVDSLSKVRAALKDITASPVICVDTEYDSFRYFREKLCLVQLAAAKKIYIFDPLSNIPLHFLAVSFANPSQVKVLHAAENDLRLLKRDYNFAFNNIFDTQRAAIILGCKNPSLSRVAEEVIGVKIDKSRGIQRSRWDMRPLSEEQVLYAAGDVQHLLAVYEKLKAALAGTALLQQAQHTFADITEIKWHPRKFDSEGYKKLEGVAGLTLAQQSRLQGLYRWRFHKAKLLDRAVWRVLSDTELLLLAKGAGE
jgi:ribonuclease D